MNDQVYNFRQNENVKNLTFNSFKMPEEAKPFLKQKVFSKVTPSILTNTNYYSRGPTSPAKVRSYFERQEEVSDSKAKTIGKAQTRSQNLFFDENNYSIFSHQENNLEPRSFEDKKESIFGYRPHIDKPSLNSTESHNKLIEYSKTRKFLEDKEYFAEVSPNRLEEETELNQSNLNLSMNNAHTDNEAQEKIIFEEPEYSNEEFAKLSKNSRLMYAESKLAVPIEKKDDENFKLLKMREMKRRTLPAFKSAQTKDLCSTPKNQKDFREGNFFIN